MIATQPTDELDNVIEEHRTTWLRQAEATLTDLDPRAYADGGMLHLLDCLTMAAMAASVSGVIAAGAEIATRQRRRVEVPGQGERRRIEVKWWRV